VHLRDALLHEMHLRDALLHEMKESSAMSAAIVEVCGDESPRHPSFHTGM